MAEGSNTSSRTAVPRLLIIAGLLLLTGLSVWLMLPRTNTIAESQDAVNQDAASQDKDEALQTINETITIAVGEEKEDVLQALDELRASDYTSGMSVATADGRPVDRDELKEVMWGIGEHDISLETQFRDGKLASLYVWDWQGREPTRYQHLLEHHEVSSISFHRDGTTSYNILETHNEGSW